MESILVCVVLDPETGGRKFELVEVGGPVLKGGFSDDPREFVQEVLFGPCKDLEVVLARRRGDPRGMWIWEGEVKAKMNRFGEYSHTEFDGQWRKPSAKEAREAVEGRELWKKKKLVSEGCCPVCGKPCPENAFNVCDVDGELVHPLCLGRR